MRVNFFVELVSKTPTTTLCLKVKQASSVTNDVTTRIQCHVHRHISLNISDFSQRINDSEISVSLQTQQQGNQSEDV